MIYEAGYDKIELYSASKGMNQNIAPTLLPLDYSYYIENIMPLSLGDGQVRYGNSLFSAEPEDDIIDGFPFSAEDGSKQQVLYFNGYETFSTSTELLITSSNQILLYSPDYELFQKDTYLKIQYRDTNGFSPVLFYEIREIEVFGNAGIRITIDENSFADNLADFYIEAPFTPNPQYVSGTQFSITIPDSFTVGLYYNVGFGIKLSINDIVYTLTISNIDISIPNQLTFTTTGGIIAPFTDVATRTLSYQSLTPEVLTISNSSGYIKVLDTATDTLLDGEGQTLGDLSVACVPRAEYFGKRLWIYNGVDPVMTWDGEVLKIYEEQVKEQASSFNLLGEHQFNFLCNETFDISKYAIGKRIRLLVNKVGDVTSAITAIIKAGSLVTITVVGIIPPFTGQNTLELFYFDRPPCFSYMKGANNRLWCLGEGAVGLDYRIPDLALKYYYSYSSYSTETDFKLFNEDIKSVPSVDISAKHGEADNLEAIVDLSGKLVFMGRKKSQVWQGSDPRSNISPDPFIWNATLPVGVYHGNLIVDLPNDAQFLSQNGFVSFGTLNIAKQFAASNTPNMDKLSTEHINTIDSNIKYRACRSFKYKNGGFCGFKIGKNNLIVSKYHTSFFWWGIFSGDFTSSSSFLSTLDDSLYLFIGKEIYQYADGLSGSPILYADRNGNRSINFVETKYVNNIKKRYSNRRYEVQADYSSSVVINTENTVNIYIAGDLTDTFVLQNLYQFPFKGDVLGTINLVDGSTSGSDPNNPSGASLGMRLDSPSHTRKDRLKFVSNNFSVTIAGSLKDGPFNLKRIRLFGVIER